MDRGDTERALERITLFLQRWYPPEVAPFVVKKQIQVIGALRDEITEKDIRLLLSRIQMVILPSFMPMEDAKKEVRKLKKELGVGL